MKIRTTEREHQFRTDFFDRLNIHQLEGLTLDTAYHFTACIEAVDYEAGEEISVETLYTPQEIGARHIIANKLGIPFYMVAQRDWEFHIYEVLYPSGEYKFLYKLDRAPFLIWWSRIKGTRQPKRLYEAQPRVSRSSFDNLLEANNMAWGGNVDGYIVKDNEIKAIVENIFTAKFELTDQKADPARYFHTKGPNYNSWLPNVKLAQAFDVPLFLFTYEAGSADERIGFTVVDSLSRRGIVYRNNVHPYQNVLTGMNNIVEAVESRLNEPAPSLNK
ncbi:hypothetical protein [Bacillus marinisedimentorum]|uniref:hypothetical protein n=1 Tax=Bacillus marinisedimentorum TaxID=1821260 RepID=UPI0007E0E2E8|nr:hypothetical protein [Bacillus marinisedimentorum]